MRLTVSNRHVATIAMSLIGVIFLTNWPMYQYTMLEGLVPLVFYIGAIGLGCIYVWLRPESSIFLLREPIFYWYLVYSITGLIWVILGGELSSDNYEWRGRFLSTLLFASGFVLCETVDLRKFAFVVFLIATFAAITFWHDFISPFFYVPQGSPGSNPGRGAGLFINANQAGGALLIMGIAVMPFLENRVRAFLLTVVVFGTVATFSRSSIVFALILAVIWVWSGQFSRGLPIVLFGLLLLVGFGFFELYRIAISSSDINFDNISERVLFFSNIGEASDFSAGERRYLVELGWQKFTENPFFGIGVGLTDYPSAEWGYPQSTHNMFLRLLVEQGLLGGVLYFVFICLLFARGVRFLKLKYPPFRRDVGISIMLIAIYFIFMGFFSHTLLQEPASVLVLAFVLGTSRRLDAH